jgi:hypothetical protein
MRGKVMEHDSSLRGWDRPPWDGLLRAFLALLDADGPRPRGDAVCDLFFADPWFLELIARRARQAVAAHAVPEDCLKDLEQEISLVFVERVSRTPDLHVDRELVEGHFGGWVWTIIDRSCIKAIQRLHRLYGFEKNVMHEVAASPKWDLDKAADVRMLVQELPPLSQAILSLFDEGYNLKDIAEIVGEEYWKVCELYRKAVAYLRQRLCD